MWMQETAAVVEIKTDRYSIGQYRVTKIALVNVSSPFPLSGFFLAMVACRKYFIIGHAHRGEVEAIISSTTHVREVFGCR